MKDKLLGLLIGCGILFNSLSKRGTPIVNRPKPVSLDLDSLKEKEYSQTPEGPLTQNDLAEPGARAFTSFDEKGDYRIINGRRVYFKEDLNQYFNGA